MISHDVIHIGIDRDHFHVETRLGTVAFNTAEDTTGFITAYLRVRLNTFAATTTAFEDDLIRFSGTRVEEPELPEFAF
jgi:hypothetical protein